MKQTLSFKPYYNWNTFNTQEKMDILYAGDKVLNLIITGIPSIPCILYWFKSCCDSFKPYYNWNTFNTDLEAKEILQQGFGFKPYYNWNTFNTIRKACTMTLDHLKF